MEKKVYIDSLMLIYDMRMEYFGSHSSKGAPYIARAKAMDYAAVNPQDRDGIRKFYREAVAINGAALPTDVAVKYFNELVTDYGSDLIEAEVILNEYENLAPLFEAPGAEGDKETFDALFASSGAANCDNLEALFGPKLNADPKNPSINQLPRKMALQRDYQTIGGSCQWPASAVVENAGKYRDALIAEYHKYPALPPVFDFMDNEAPAKVRRMKSVWTEDGYILFWTAPKYKEEMNRAVQYVVYRFNDKEKVNIDDPSHIVAITRDNFYKLPYEDGKTKYRYVVTALDRLHNESKSVGKKIKL